MAILQLRNENININDPQKVANVFTHFQHHKGIQKS